MLEPGGLGGHVEEINTKAVELAFQARDNAAVRPVAIVGSICEWTFVEESEWNTPEAVGRAVREQAKLLSTAGVEVLALEMCERSEFSAAAVEAASETDLPLWIGVSGRRRKDAKDLTSFSYADRGFDELVRVVSKYPAMAINIMHTPVPDVDEALRIVREHWDGPIGIYPEAGYFIMPNWQFVDVIEPQDLAEAAKRWVGDGVRMVGGCCGLGPEHIAAMCAVF
jgi:homocysteine S-methyltransferase